MNNVHKLHRKSEQEQVKDPVPARVLESVNATSLQAALAIAAVTIVASMYLFGVLLTLGLVVVGIVVAACAGELLTRNWIQGEKDFRGNHRNPFTIEDGADGEVATSRPPGIQRPRLVRFIGAHDASSAPAPAEVRLPEQLLPDHRGIVQSYLQSATMVAQALNACFADQSGRAPRMNPALVQRFAELEAAYAGLGYRPLSVVELRSTVAAGAEIDKSLICCRLLDGEDAPLAGPGLQANYARKRASR